MGQSIETATGKGVVVITGASSGIGAASALAFARERHPLLLIARRTDRLESLQQKILAEVPSPAAVECVTADVTDREAIFHAVKQAELAHGPIACLVNNAVLSVNVLGVLNGMAAVMDQMKARGSGTVINVSSIAGRKTFPNHAVYCATKFAVHALTENIREEVAAKGVRCVTIAPGVVETELLSHTTDDSVRAGYESWKHEGLKDSPLSPEDVANSILFAFKQPPHVCIREIVLAPVLQEP